MSIELTYFSVSIWDLIFHTNSLDSASVTSCISVSCACDEQKQLTPHQSVDARGAVGIWQNLPSVDLSKTLSFFRRAKNTEYSENARSFQHPRTHNGYNYMKNFEKFPLQSQKLKTRQQEQAGFSWIAESWRHYVSHLGGQFRGHFSSWESATVAVLPRLHWSGTQSRTFQVTPSSLSLRESVTHSGGGGPNQADKWENKHKIPPNGN